MTCPERGGPMVAGEPAADRLMDSIDVCGGVLAGSLTRDRVAVVLRALADHTALEAARTHRRSTDHASDFHPTSTSIGRWLHDVADQLDHR